MTYRTTLHVELSYEAFCIAKRKIEKSGLGRVCNVSEVNVSSSKGNVNLIRADFEFDRLCLNSFGNRNLVGYSEVPGTYSLFFEISEIISSGNVEGSSCSTKFSGDKSKNNRTFHPSLEKIKF